MRSPGTRTAAGRDGDGGRAVRERYKVTADVGGRVRPGLI